jgi:histidinol-phosphate/aromatic aminotransferase/cobyric acid decarboxylase-like protein
MLERGVVIRPMGDALVRISVGTAAENDVALRALGAALGD